MNSRQNNPNKILDLLNQGLALHAQGQLSSAHDCYHKALRLDPLHFDALHLIGIVNAQTGRLDLAIQQLSKAITVISTLLRWTKS